jgi:hypothetical protein
MVARPKVFGLTWFQIQGAWDMCGIRFKALGPKIVVRPKYLGFGAVAGSKYLGTDT